jgi:GntR family transcriptional regulator
MAEPMYQQIASELRDQIESGELEPGSQLPTELDLREKFQASRNTIRDAIKRLTALGLVETRAGQGTFVAQKIDPFVTTLSAKPGSAFGGGEGATYLSQVSETHRRADVSTPKVEVQVPPAEIARRLRIGSGDQVVSRHQQRFIDGTPWSMQTSFYPMDYATQAPRLLMAGNIEEGAVRHLNDTLGLKQAGYRDWITARNPDPNEQIFFRIPHDSTVFEIFRTAFDESGKPLRVTVTIFPTDRNQFIVNSGNVPEPEYDMDITDE